MFGIAATASGLISFAYLAGYRFRPLLTVSMLHACTIAGLAPLADALALAAAGRERTSSYGWVRGTGSAAFVVGNPASGLLVARGGLASVIVSIAPLFLVMAAATARVPPAPARDGPSSIGLGGIRELMTLKPFRRTLLVAAPVIGSHDLNDGFAVIRRRETGIGPGAISLLWSEAVASEVLVFVLVGPWILARLGTAPSALLPPASASCAGRPWP